MCRSFDDLLVAKNSEKMNKYLACNGILCYMVLLSWKGLRNGTDVKIIGIHRYPSECTVIIKNFFFQHILLSLTPKI